jgi:hypothetical protein
MRYAVLFKSPILLESIVAGFCCSTSHNTRAAEDAVGEQDNLSDQKIKSSTWTNSEIELEVVLDIR